MLKVGFGPIRKYQTGLKSLAREKYSSLFYQRKTFYKTLPPGANVVKLFTDVSYEFRNKLESLSLANISSLICLLVKQELTLLMKLLDAPL